MSKRRMWILRLGTPLAALLIALVFLPLLNVGLSASLEAWRLRKADNHALSGMLIQTVEARKPEGIALASHMMVAENCDIDVKKLPDVAGQNGRSIWQPWGQTEAFIEAKNLLRHDVDLMSGSYGWRVRYVDEHTSEIERRFLLGCVTGTLTARLCALRVERLLEAAETAEVPADQRQRAVDQRQWRDKTLCALALGLSRPDVAAHFQQE